MHGLPAPSLHLIWSSPSVMIPCQIVPIDKPGAVSYPTQSRLQLREGFKFRRGWFFPHSPSGSVQPALLRCFQHRSLAGSRAEIIGPRSVERKGGLDLQLLEQNAPVCTENSDSDVLVVQPTEERTRRNASGPLNRSGYRRILVQGTMCPRLIVELCV